MQPMVPAWLYNDSLIPGISSPYHFRVILWFSKISFYFPVSNAKWLLFTELFKKVLDYTMTPTGIDTAKLYPILISSGLPREALGQIWALANRTTPGKLTKEELYTVLALIGVAQVETLVSEIPNFPKCTYFIRWILRSEVWGSAYLPSLPLAATVMWIDTVALSATQGNLPVIMHLLCKLKAQWGATLPAPRFWRAIKKEKLRRMPAVALKMEVDFNEYFRQTNQTASWQREK